MSATPKPGRNNQPAEPDAGTISFFGSTDDPQTSPILGLYHRLMESAVVNVRDKIVLGIGYALDYEMLRLHSRGARVIEARFSPGSRRLNRQPGAVRRLRLRPG